MFDINKAIYFQIIDVKILVDPLDIGLIEIDLLYTEDIGVPNCEVIILFEYELVQQAYGIYTTYIAFYDDKFWKVLWHSNIDRSGWVNAMIRKGQSIKLRSRSYQILKLCDRIRLL